MPNNIKNYIQKSGVKNTYIANQLGCHKTEISQWIADRRTPNHKRLRMLAHLLKCRMLDLYPSIKFNRTYKLNNENKD